MNMQYRSYTVHNKPENTTIQYNFKQVKNIQENTRIKLKLRYMNDYMPQPQQDDFFSTSHSMNHVSLEKNYRNTTSIFLSAILRQIRHEDPSHLPCNIPQALALSVAAIVEEEMGGSSGAVSLITIIIGLINVC